MRRLRVARTAAYASGVITPTTGTARDSWSAGQRGRGGGVARDDDQLHAEGLEVAGDLEREAADLGQRPRPVRQARVVAEVDEVLVRHRHQALVQDGEAAHAGVEDADRPRIHRGDSRIHAVTTPVRIGTCSWADDALVKHWYPKEVPARERLAWYAERFSTVEVDSTYYRVPDVKMVQGWAERTPPGFVMHVKAFGLMTRHPVRLEQLPPELREGMPVDDRGRVDRPPRERAREVFRAFLEALEPLRAAGKLGGILFQLPPYVVWKPSSLDYLEWAAEQLGGDRMLVEFRHARGSRSGVARGALALARGAGARVRDRRRAEGRRAQRAADGGRGDVAARVRPLPRPQRRDVEQARRRRGASASTTCTPRTSCASGSSRCASWPARARRRTRSSTTTTRRTASRRRRRARSCSRSCSRRRTCRSG